MQRYSEQATRLQVVLNVRTAYFNARAMKELVAVAQETLDDQNKHLAQVQGQVTVGTQPPIALAQQKAACANAVVQLIQADNNYETSKAQLNQAAGIVGGTDYDVGDEQVAVPEDEEQPLDTLASKAIAARPEIATFQKQRESQEATLSAIKARVRPHAVGVRRGLRTPARISRQPRPLAGSRRTGTLACSSTGRCTRAGSPSRRSTRPRPVSTASTRRGPWRSSP